MVVVVGGTGNWSGGRLVVVVVVAAAAGFVESTLGPGAGRIDFVGGAEVVVTLLVVVVAVVVVVVVELVVVVVEGTAGSGTVEGGNEVWCAGAAAKMDRPAGLDGTLR